MKLSHGIVMGALLLWQWGTAAEPVVVTEPVTLAIDHALGGGAMPFRTEVEVELSEEELLLRFRCFDPEAARQRGSKALKHDDPVWDDDCVEFFLAPCAADPTTYYHFGFNPLGTVYDAFMARGAVDVAFDGAVTTRSEITEEFWLVEARIPLRGLNRTPLDAEWRVNLGREGRTSQAGFGTWAPVAMRFHEPESFGTWQLPKLRDNALVLAANERLRKSLVEPTALALGLACDDAETTLELWRRAAAKYYSLPREREEANRQLARAMRADIDNFRLTALSPGEKVRRTAVPEEPAPASLRLDAARGELESVAFALISGDRPVKGIQIVVEAPLPFELKQLGYVPIERPTPGGTRIAGEYPDPLLPPVTPFELAAAETRQFWLTFAVPAAAEAGIYQGRIVVSNAEQRVELPLEVRVYDVNLPRQGALKSIVCVEPYRFHHFFANPEDAAAATRAISAEASRQRLTADWRLPWEELIVGEGETLRLDAAALDRELTERVAAGATTFRLDTYFFLYRADSAERLRLMQEYLTARPEWRDRFYFYCFDEPASGTVPGIRELVVQIREFAPDAKVIGTTQWRTLAGYVDWWIPVNTHLNNPDFLAFLLQRRQLGEEFWMYTCFNTSMTREADNWKIDAPGVTHRALGWQLWRFGCTGYLYWHLQAVGEPAASVWTRPDQLDFCNGDGFLFYPPRTPEEKQAYSSLRLEMTREGFDDYELLTLLRNRLDAVAASGAELRRFKPDRLDAAYALLDVDGLVRRTDDYEMRWEVYQERHRQLLEMLEELR